ncbi:MAG: peptide chain release factor N(5)-glutamine methyltransferase [Neisseriaceae bacterium]|nr:peptide chain release factor N(5)-glutamine methyltransferase [Neisseriaceae bacterium]
MTFSEWIMASNLPRLEARLLVQHVCHWEHSQVITRGADSIPDDILMRLNDLGQRRVNGEPIAYLIGRREFYGRNFYVNSDVLIPRPETELLLETVLDSLPENSSIWDIGCGSGILSVSIKCERYDCTVFASDISCAALSVAQRNAQTWNAKINFLQGSWFDCESLPEKYSLDVIVSNPPYIRADDIHLQQGDLRFEPQIALTDFNDGLEAFRILIANAPNFLKSGGKICLEHGFDQNIAIRDLLQQRGFINIQTLSDLAGLPRVTVGFKK